MYYKCAFNYVKATLNKEKKRDFHTNVCFERCMFIIHTKLTCFKSNLWLINTFSLILVGFVYAVNQLI